MFVAGVDGCRAGWVAFEVEVPSITTSVEVVNLPTWLRERPPDLACVGIDIPYGRRSEGVRQGSPEAARSAAWQQRLPCALPPRIGSADLCRGKLD